MTKYVRKCREAPVWKQLHGSPHFREVAGPSALPHELSDEEWSTSVAKVLTNTFRTSGGGSTWLILRLTTAIFNHSCSPNAATYELSDGSNLVVALKNICPGDEITICYNSDLFMLPPSERQARLDFFGFKCACDRCALPFEQVPPYSYLTQCRSGSQTPLDLENVMKQHMDELEARVLRMSSLDDAIVIARTCQVFLTSWELHSCHWRMLTLRKWLASAVVDLAGRLPAADPLPTDLPSLHACVLDVISDDRLFYPMNHADRLVWLNSWWELMGGERGDDEDWQYCHAERTRLLSLYTLQDSTAVVDDTAQLFQSS